MLGAARPSYYCSISASEPKPYREQDAVPAPTVPLLIMMFNIKKICLKMPLTGTVQCFSLFKFSISLNYRRKNTFDIESALVPQFFFVLQISACFTIRSVLGLEPHQNFYPGAVVNNSNTLGEKVETFLAARSNLGAAVALCGAGDAASADPPMRFKRHSGALYTILTSCTLCSRGLQEKQKAAWLAAHTVQEERKRNAQTQNPYPSSQKFYTHLSGKTLILGATIRYPTFNILVARRYFKNLPPPPQLLMKAPKKCTKTQ
jgi:hypothetical protein